MTCLHEEKELIILNGKCHYGKNICSNCKKFLSWEKNPEITKICEERDLFIDQFIKDNPKLSPSNLSYLYSIKGKLFITPKQNTYFNSITSRSQVK